MDRQSLVEYAKSIGAHAALRSFGAPEGEETVCVFVGSMRMEDIQGYKHAIFIEKQQENWHIGFALAGRTRALNESELKELLSSWVKSPSYEIFHAVETTIPISNAVA